MSGLRILPVTILVAALVLFARAHELAGAIVRGQSPLSALIRPAVAAEEPAPTPTPSEAAAEGGERPPPPPLPAAPSAGELPPIDAGAATGAERELAGWLRDRREELDQRARALDQREAVLQATEKRLREEFDKIAALKTEIEALLAEQQGRDRERVDAAARTYETMKPKDAAGILNGMEMSLLMPIMEAMKGTKRALILAEMDPARARAVTEQLVTPLIPPGTAR